MNKTRIKPNVALLLCVLLLVINIGVIINLGNKNKRLSGDAQTDANFGGNVHTTSDSSAESTVWKGWQSAREEATLQEISLEGIPTELFVGEQVECTVKTVPADIQCQPIWHSSDKSIAVVEDGILTAHSEGQVTLTVLDELSGTIGKVKVLVTGDFTQIAAAALEHMVVSLTDAEAADKVRVQQQRMEKCGHKEAQSAADALGRLLDCADGGEQCDFAQLEETLGLKAAELRTAAEIIRMRGQMTDDSVTLTFTGDCTFGYNNEYNSERRFPAVYKKSGSVTYPFDRVKHIFAADDITVINYEATLADKGSPEANKKYHLRGEPEYVKILSGSSVEVANLANNHTLDYKKKGYEQTAKRLSDEGIAVLHTDTPVIRKVNGIEVVLVSAGHWKFPTEYDEQIRQMLEQVEKYKKPDNAVIVNLHWGGEYIKVPDEGQIEAAHRLIDAGADMIVSHHAHIIQSIELYKDKVIAYGLGNFSFGGTHELNEKETFILRASFAADEKGSIKMKQWSVIPCHATGTGTLSNNFQPVTLHGEEARRMLNVLLSRSKSIGGCAELPASYFEY